LLERECPPSVVRAHIDDPSVYEPLWRHLSEYTALGAGDAATSAVPRRDRVRSGARSVRRDDRVHGADRRRREHRTVALVDDPTMPFVLELDRVDRVALVFPGPQLAVVDVADVTARFIATVDFSRRLFQLDTAKLDPTKSGAQPLAAADYARWSIVRTRARGRARRNRAAASSTWPSRTPRSRKQFDVPHRLVPGDPAQARRHVARPRTRDGRRALRGDDDRRRHPDRTPRVSRRQSRGRRGGAPDPEGRHPDPRRHRLHVGARTSTSTCAAPPRRVPLRHTGWHLDRLADLLIDA